MSLHLIRNAISDELRSWPFIRTVDRRRKAEIAVFQDATRSCADGFDILSGIRPRWSRLCLIKFQARSHLRCQVVFTKPFNKICCPHNRYYQETTDHPICPRCKGRGWYEVQVVSAHQCFDLDAPDGFDRLYAYINNSMTQ